MNDAKTSGLPPKKIGTKQRLQRSNSPEELKALLSKIKSYAHASPKTLRRCERIYAARMAELKAKK